ncbi:PAS domain-containing protein [Sulfitobacter mediterraneus]|uniref:sensor histidine kinase n=1 Tax=Sulfitobacter mediterraneus TaxID=83219 RepID=UPI001933D769|nr:PAS domain-containing sensor histidine kinase [Sulfitobacter mediterraneus]MBM1312290.1 PAS domain-containing protein [Sulfitobacter mediterraneus]MBM1316168.1 PAS domain-containing protein [Sulfitobacter mediterraneus]MBM1324533.1 PAS domain-containing protein [Sulfitobacter mediterraneus]MBM1328444.1 PAS domain-containing protein [Sulfitobacter mediterraneus]MBM1399794.1 PAS domain-containing protein [Sulfitobacter mediterraneus]
MKDNNYLKAELTDLIQSDESTWNFIQQGSLDGIWYWDLEDPANEWMSPELWQLFGIDPATKTHSPDEWQDIIFPEDLALALKNFEAHCADPDCPYDQVVRYRHADGSIVWVRCRGLAIRDETGKPIRMLGAHTDLTAVKKSEENAREGWRAAELANSELKSFAYSVSHDMKAPANTLKLLLDEMDHLGFGAEGDEARSILDMAQQTVARMQTQIDDILDYTSVIGLEPELEPLDLSKVAADAVAALQADILVANGEVKIGPLPWVNGAATQMNILFQNLISNGIKFRRKDVAPAVRIDANIDPVDGKVTIRFTDNGIGISEADQPRIFALFQRLHTRENFAGTGIGLPLCLRIAMIHKGTLEVASTPGEGTCFSLILPGRSGGDAK